MSDKTQLHLAELMGSKICHDLVNSVGSLSNGIELLSEMKGAVDKEALDLIARSANLTLVRLKFFRLAFGLNTNKINNNWDQYCHTIESYGLEYGTNISWQSNKYTGNLSDGEAKLLLNLFHIAITCLIRGGKMSIEISPNGLTDKLKIIVGGKICNIKKPVYLAATEEKKLEDISPSEVTAYLARLHAKSLNKAIQIKDNKNNQITFEIISL
tara:strand:- start:565 stop:1203 length:639 start_codon:yes stop_codon:yes gene_type:complete